jgi:hypothetical protein
MESVRRLDAIVVPTVRPWLLSSAVALAGEAGCPLVVLCSTVRQAKQADRECSALKHDVLVTYVTPAAASYHLGVLTPEPPGEPSRHTDIARKRNIGLLLARLSGWRTIMFLDDDIRGMTATAVSRGAALTERFEAVGFRIGQYPDNSVVCHAFRLTGGSQDVFPGGNALLLDVTRSNSFFPAIYNEDWLFLFDTAQRRSIAVAGTFSQLDYQPFADPGRATSEEFGDVIAEGLYLLLHEGGTVADATYAYWRGTLERRSRLIDHTATQLLLRPDRLGTHKCVLTSLAAARTRLASITELACLSFIRAWRSDVDVWQSNLGRVPLLVDLASAARYLNLPTPDNV